MVAGIGRVHAVTHLFVRDGSILCTTTGSEEIVVQFVVAGGFGSIEQRHRSTLQSNDDRLVCLIGEDVPTQSIVIPTKVVGVIESTPNVIPVTLPRLRVVRICSHFRHGQNRLLVCVVRACDLIDTPSRRRQRHSRSVFLCVI